MRLMLGLLAATLGAKAGASFLQSRAGLTFDWATDGALEGIAIGDAGRDALALRCRARCARRSRARRSSSRSCSSNVLPVNPYFDIVLADWRQGRYLHFNGLAHWLAWVWPYAALGWLASAAERAWLARRRARRRERRSTSLAIIDRHSSSPTLMDSFYKYHVFFCLNQREPDAPRPSCANCNAQAMQEHAKKRVKQLGLAGDGKVRINKAGCLDRCELGPVVVVYPEGTWYTYVDETDIDEIVDSHLANGKIVERLLIDQPGLNAPSHERANRKIPDRRPGRARSKSRSIAPKAAPRGIALVAHPHPLFGGTMDNKVAQTLARTFVQLGYTTYRSNFRGVGQTAGEHDNGIGERDDLLAVIDHMRAQPGPGRRAARARGLFVRHLRAVACGEAACATRGRRSSGWCSSARRRAAGKSPTVPETTLVIHGEVDETVPIHVGLRLGAAAGIAGRRDSGRRAFLPSQAAYSQARDRRRVALSASIASQAA